jgi:SAM-dependent methyltransferase
VKLYSDLATWWPLLSPPEEYAEEAAFYQAQLLASGDEPARSLLELGSGGGNNASFMKQAFSMTLVEPSAGMRAWSRTLNPECEHLEGDMRTVRLGREFDRVFIHDAIVYMTTIEDLRRAIETAFVHCRPGGAALFAPDHLRENFDPPVTDCGGADEGGRGLRYLEWTWDPDPADTTYTVDYALMMRDGDGTIRIDHDRHIEGLFTRAEWLRTLSEVGFVPRAVRYDHSELEPSTYELFLAIKPRS